MTQKWEGKSLVGGRLGQFDVKEEIARGGMGVVYKGYQPSLDRWVAIKTLPLDLAGDRDLVARFQREAEAMVRLNHANIVQIIDRGEDTGQYYFAMEFVEGPSVKDLLKTETIDSDKVFDILIQTCEGLDYAHKKGLVHRDIKPANLLYEEKTGTVKIADFGIAHFSKKDEDMLTLTADNVGMGTMNYMSPEQKVNAKNVDHRSDIYALGVIVYEAFTGKLPLGKFKLPSEVNSKLPRQLDEIVAKCLSTEPEERFDSCATMKAHLVEAKASTHDKTIKRSLRDAIDRTLTAVSPKGNKAVGCAILAVFLLGFLAVVAFAGVLFVKGRSTKMRLDRAAALMAKARDRAQKLGADHDAGKTSFEDGEASVRNSESLPDDAKAAQLEVAAGKYQAAASAAIDKKKGDVKSVADRIEDARKRAQAQPQDGLAKAALAKLDDADKAAKAAQTALAKAEEPEGELAGFDLRPADDGANAAAAILDKAQKISDGEKDWASKLEKAKPGSPERKAADEKLAALREARDKGDVDGAWAAFQAAGEAVSVATNTKVDTTAPVAPSPMPTQDPSSDAKSLEQYAIADRESSDARKVAEGVVAMAKKQELADGAKEFQAAAAAQADASKLKPREGAEKLASAKASFEAAATAALAALEAKRQQARKDADVARDTSEYAAAAELDADCLDGSDRVAQAKAISKQIDKLKAATAKAAGLAADHAKKAVDEKRGEALAAQANARARLGPGSGAVLKDGDEALKRADDAIRTGNLEVAKSELASAAGLYAKASWPTPKTISFPKTGGFVLATNLTGLEAPDGSPREKCALDSIAGCPKGFVVSYKDKLYCFAGAPPFDQVLGPGTASGLISALATGEGDEIFVATFKDGAISRFTTARGAIKPVSTPLPGELGSTQSRPAAIAMAYDPRTKTLFSATTKGMVYAYSTTSGDILAQADLKDSQISIPRSIAALSDGSFVVAGDADKERPGAEAQWRYAAARFKPSTDGSRYALAEVYNRDHAPAAVAAVGDGILAVDHDEKGHVWIWPTHESLKQAPDPDRMFPAADAKLTLPFANYATRLAVYGKRAFVLDLPWEDDPNGSFSPWRRRVKFYDLD